MLDTWLSRSGSAFDRFLTALARALHTAGATPNMLTHAALGCGVVAGALMCVEW